MGSKVETRYRTIEELSDPHWGEELGDPLGKLQLTNAKKNTFQKNPFSHGPQSPSQIVGVLGNDVVGNLNAFFYQIVADKDTYEVLGSDSFYVYEKYRRTMYALELMRIRSSLSKDHISLNCRASHSLQMLIRATHCQIFPLKTFISFRRSNQMAEVHFPRFLRGCGCALLNMAFWGQRKVCSLMAATHLSGVRMRKIELSDAKVLEDITNMVSQDWHRFRVNINQRWIKWVSENDFIEGARKTIYGFFRNQKLIAFVMARYVEGNEKCPGEIYEWQAIPQDAHLIPWMIFKVAQDVIPHAEFVSVMVSPDDSELSRTLGRLMYRQKGEHIVSLGSMKDSPLRAHEGYESSHNWRLRPAMGDSCFW